MGRSISIPTQNYNVIETLNYTILNENNKAQLIEYGIFKCIFSKYII
jgi:hypothetical protein